MMICRVRQFLKKSNQQGCWLIFFAICLFFMQKGEAAPTQERVVPRIVIALYDSTFQKEIYYLNLHQFAEMPLNHLGLILYYHDLQQGFPNIKEDESVLGVLTWFPYKYNVSNPHTYIEWAIEAIDAGKKFVVLGNPGFNEKDKAETPRALVNRFWAKLGLYDTDKNINQTYRAKILYADPFMTQFERRYQGDLPSFRVMASLSPLLQTHLKMGLKDNPDYFSLLVTTHPNGGYGAPNYVVYRPPNLGDLGDIREWYVNPFEFFRLAFGTDQVPKPDTTTLAGRRIYYSQIDGDGWSNVTELEEYQKVPTLSSEVILNKIIIPNPDLPVTVGPIAADMDLKWVGTPKNREIARAFFNLPQVEVGCHTFTHPFDWGFFAHYQPSYEEPYLPLYPDGGWNVKKKDKPGIWKMVKNVFTEKEEAIGAYDAGIGELNEEEDVKREIGKLMPGYKIPRAYALKPFNLDLEIFGAINEINSLTMDQDPVKIYMWSGNCLPFQEAVAFTREAKVRNINGGDSRFDNAYNSYGWVSSIGRQVQNQQQIYASNSNENTYTNMWTERFYFFTELVRTFHNTETPIRVKPMNLYYHMYSGQKMPSLSALQNNIRYIQAQSCIPIRTSHFAAIADGFYTTQIDHLGGSIWRIRARGALQTIRFDHSVFKGVHFEASKGVIGQQHLQGSLYVYLDEAVDEPVIRLKDIATYFEEPREMTPYLVHSRWYVRNLHMQSPSSFSYEVEGFGLGEMKWRVPEDGLYQVQASNKEKTYDAVEVNSHEGLLTLQLDLDAIKPVIIKIDKK